MGKGSRRRPGNDKAFREGWDRAFGKRDSKPQTVLEYAEDVDRVCKEHGVRAKIRDNADGIEHACDSYVHRVGRKFVDERLNP